ncbi:MAG: hypothetical protein WEC59_03320 [Salibacteraceae bacterium]
MKATGFILLILGLIGTIVFGIQAMQDSDGFNLFGIEIIVSKATWTPLIISGAILIAGLIITFFRNK